MPSYCYSKYVALLVAITGNIGCGKSLVGSLFSDHGIPVVDSDHLTHELYEKDEEVKRQITEKFGTLDRSEIAKIVFKEPKQKKILEGIIHPVIAERLGEWVRENSDKEILVHQIPLVFEAKLEERYDKVITVITDEKIQIERIQSRNPEMSVDAIMKRIKSQMPQEEKKARSDYFIDNSGSIDETMKQVDKIIESLKADCAKEEAKC